MRRPEGFDGPPRPRREPEQPAAAEPTPGVEEPAVVDAAAPTEDLDAIVTRGRGRRRSESHASRTDRLLREAELRQLRLDRIDARRTQARARQADRDRKRAERSEVRRFTAASRRRLRRSLIVVGALAAAFAVLVGLVHSPLMAVREIEVQGTQRLEASALQAALAGHLGQPIATVTDAGVREDLERFTGLESFVIDVVPPGTIVVRVVERQPVVVASLDGQDTMLDPAGVHLGMPDGTPLPRLESVEVGSDAFGAVAASLVAMPTVLREQVASITATTSDDVTMTLASGQQVVWGSADEAGLKADVLTALVAAADPATPVTFDVSAPEHPVVRP
ncbi:FtsQ-type POTRA domain-containing protein [Agrococcus jejuensis]|uniref:Cell division protein FtsQ n=1 Tax=Agrococcus jejuensis TaxID=399736 RepID=A0A1G8ABD1_9MICO|nr:FtsQ-type POTRA domain-containing protein [Agrococcus jejuensis]SDH17660.1 cell division protein FtsQ [Agrococcus jejuensis]